MQAHYRGTLDFSNDALLAAEKGLQRLWNAGYLLKSLATSNENEYEVIDIKNNILTSLNDDLNTPQAIAELFEAARVINLVNDGKLKINAINLQLLNELFDDYLINILGIKEEIVADDPSLDGLMQLLFEMRAQAKADKNFALSDQIRDKITALGFIIKDGKDGSSWGR